MGQSSSSGLTQYDVEEVIQYADGAWKQEEVEGLYRRFRALDRGRKGYLSADEFLGIPELSINPLAQRLVRIYGNINFKEFVKLLSAFSSRASRETKLQYMYMVHDVDGDGIISKEDMLIMLRQLAGSTLSEDDMHTLVNEVLQRSSSPQGLDFAAFKAALKDADLAGMVVKVPVEL